MASNDSDRVPVVGLSTYLERAKQGVWDVRAAFLPQQYFDAVTASGGAAVLLPPQPNPEPSAETVLDGLDGLILTGGLDVQPELYGAERHPLTDPARADRDAWELALLRGARRRGIPVFGICRGLQLINVAFGGSLHQHLPDDLGTERYRIGGGVFADNTVIVEDGTRLAGLVGAGEYGVHSYHHQGVDRVGEGLTVTARTDDGLVQAFELPGDEYLVAVQWHPEENSADRRLFLGLVAAASAHRAARDAASAAGATTSVPRGVDA
ncbi:gamma-glutamyl-gamma-aminobutyrate hydrolase family protein [Microbacterium sp. cx-55]|uniref:gamma-glutamyl-gamma-aminobutyrate hydrolase family protein n=1 Tax=Microbacterium sp. cx-55 TaxID=2875948 RepID=UPI001CBBCF8B|nr:gamma-glutamyl-gamma-aminobutyrate hydrolase family protein [Microbacterium sp. cx-55]MBZ4487446.1 gamma-glutamyl-gamma-aminobutyrate hydrolase family protein [Microbacterium sp. cx-55]UGB35466.1 gamma-glutamyl-gamma-aminobutyrate hydrolase family protein [Microbacterium sp. cx-55]